MSSFNINGPSNNRPMVESSQNLGKDGGGGGNTGFMNMRNKKKQQSSKKNEEDNSVFLEGEIEDTFIKTGSPKKSPQGGKFLGAISNFINKKQAPAQIPPTDNDSFVKKEPEIEEYEEKNNFQNYNIVIDKPNDILEDDEYEIADDDDYYDGIDV